MPTVHANLLLQMLHLREEKPLTFPLPYVWYMHVCAGTHACLCVCAEVREPMVGSLSIFLLLICMFVVCAYGGGICGSQKRALELQAAVSCDTDAGN